MIYVYGISCLWLYMADLEELYVRSSDRTAEGGSLSHCTIAKGKIIFIITCRSQDLNKVEVVCCPGHFTTTKLAI